MASTAGSLYKLGFSESTFLVNKGPELYLAITSVKVPPLSIQNSHIINYFL